MAITGHAFYAFYAFYVWWFYFPYSRALAKGMLWPGTYVRPQLPPGAADGLYPRRETA
jgi:hypothetical protein